MILALHILGAIVVGLLCIGGGFLGTKVFCHRPLDRQTVERLGRVAARNIRRLK